MVDKLFITIREEGACLVIFLVPKVRSCDLLRLRSKPLTLNQSDTTWKSNFDIVRTESYNFDNIKIGVSSAYKKMWDKTTDINTWLVYKKSKGRVYILVIPRSV